MLFPPLKMTTFSERPAPPPLTNCFVPMVWLSTQSHLPPTPHLRVVPKPNLPYSNFPSLLSSNPPPFPLPTLYTVMSFLESTNSCPQDGAFPHSVSSTEVFILPHPLFSLSSGQMSTHPPLQYSKRSPHFLGSVSHK